MYVLPDIPQFHAKIESPIVEVYSRDAIGGFRTALAVEIPLMILALSTVALRLYSRLAIKKKLAPDDVLILLGAVSLRN